jgi:hypothetical protein
MSMFRRGLSRGMMVLAMVVRVIRLDQHNAKSIIKFIAQEMEICDYFQDRPLGVNCQNGFVIFDKDGNVSLIEHHPASPRALSRAACALAVS